MAALIPALIKLLISRRGGGGGGGGGSAQKTPYEYAQTAAGKAMTAQLGDLQREQSEAAGAVVKALGGASQASEERRAANQKRIIGRITGQ